MKNVLYLSFLDTPIPTPWESRSASAVSSASSMPSFSSASAPGKKIGQSLYKYH